MAKQLTEIHLAKLTEDERAHVERARSIASWMDDKISIGGFGVGLDGLIGLIPVGGDAISALIGLYHYWLAGKLKLGFGTQLSILINITLDFLVGAVPLIGDLIDFAFRSHRRNMKLIERKLAEKLEA